jgi:N6-L-threonylcarbamoyladenine synthase
MDKLASIGDSSKFTLPSAAISDGSLDFSFSGLKTYVLNSLNSLEQKGETYKREDVAASFTEAFTSSVCKKIEDAIKKTGYKTLVVAGGVSANSHLRKALAALCEKMKTELCIPPLSLCGDNGAMIAAQAYYEYKEGNVADASLNANAAG